MSEQLVEGARKSIRTNNISAEDTENVKRYEDELRHRNAIITSKIMLLGICIAKAWKRTQPAAAAMHMVPIGSYTRYQLVILDRWLRHRNAIITSKIVNLGSYTEYQLLILDRWLRHRNAIITLLSRK